MNLWKTTRGLFISAFAVTLCQFAIGETGGTCTGPSAGIGPDGNGTMTCGGGCSEQDWVCTVGGEEVGSGTSSVITCACDDPTDSKRPVTNGCCKFAWLKDPNTGKHSIPGKIGGCSMTPCNPGFCEFNSSRTEASCVFPQGG